MKFKLDFFPKPSNDPGDKKKGEEKKPEKKLGSIESARNEFFKNRHIEIQKKATEKLKKFIQSDEFKQHFESWTKKLLNRKTTSKQFQDAVEFFVRDKNVTIYNETLMAAIRVGSAYQDDQLDPESLMVTADYRKKYDEIIVDSPLTEDQKQDEEVVKPPIYFDQIKKIYESSVAKPENEEAAKDVA